MTPCLGWSSPVPPFSVRPHRCALPQRAAVPVCLFRCSRGLYERSSRAAILVAMGRFPLSHRSGRCSDLSGRWSLTARQPIPLRWWAVALAGRSGGESSAAAAAAAAAVVPRRRMPRAAGRQTGQERRGSPQSARLRSSTRRRRSPSPTIAAGRGRFPDGKDPSSMMPWGHQRDAAGCGDLQVEQGREVRYTYARAPAPSSPWTGSSTMAPAMVSGSCGLRDRCTRCGAGFMAGAAPQGEAAGGEPSGPVGRACRVRGRPADRDVQPTAGRRAQRPHQARRGRRGLDRPGRGVRPQPGRARDGALGPSFERRVQGDPRLGRGLLPLRQRDDHESSERPVRIAVRRHHLHPHDGAALVPGDAGPGAGVPASQGRHRGGCLCDARRECASRRAGVPGSVRHQDP
jgi:hypothetical protein